MPRYTSPRVLYKFTDAAEFAARHKAATRAEYEIELAAVKQFNARIAVYRAWVIRKTGFCSFIMRADLRDMGKLLPQPGQIFAVVFVDNNEEDSDADEDSSGADDEDESAAISDKGKKARRTGFRCRVNAETLDLGGGWNNHAEFTLDLTPKLRSKLGRLVEPLVRGTAMPMHLKRKDSQAVNIRLVLKASDVTMNAELDALDCMIDGTASEAGRDAFSYLLRFEKPKNFVNLLQKFPQMEHLNLVKSDKVRNGLQTVLGGLDVDQAAAFHGLRSLPAGICFVPGGESSICAISSRHFVHCPREWHCSFNYRGAMSMPKHQIEITS